MGSRSLILIRNIELQRNEGVSPPGLEKLRKSHFLSNYAELPAIFQPVFHLKNLAFTLKSLEISDVFLSFCKDTPIFVKKHVDFLIIELFPKSLIG